uniref:sulfotransferase family 2 domain-containing protein n=1 Tax=Gelidibacter sp. TaxID=2018083 RepID=UPI00404AF844
MIINHEHKFIFIKTQKTAGTSMEIALSGLCSKNDIVTPISIDDEAIRIGLGYQTPINYKIPLKKYSKKELVELILFGNKKSYYNHMSCEEIKQNIGDNMYNDYYKFCFERNPFDKVISLFYHQGGYNKWKSIEDFIKDGGLKIIKGYDQYTINNVIAVDDVFKFEQIEEALKIITHKLNLKTELSLPEVKAKSQFRNDKRHYKEVLTDTERRLIETIWAREINLMSYQF